MSYEEWLELSQSKSIEDLPNEVWKSIDGFPNYYVSNYSRIKSIYHYSTGEKRRIVKQRKSTSESSYYVTEIAYKNKFIHRLVAETFIPNTNNKLQINHINGNKFDNRIENLEWVTPSENMLHSYRVLGRKSAMFGKFGKDNHSSKPVYQLTEERKIVKEWGSCREAARSIGVGYTGITRACRGGRKRAHGFKWVFKSELSVS